ncbi:MAG: hypothetical protein AAFW98_01320 [Pseudomonadota bacterium]
MAKPKAAPRATPATALPWPRFAYRLPRVVLRGFMPPRKVDVLIVGNSHAGALSLAHDPERDRGIEVLRTGLSPQSPHPMLTAPLTARYQPQAVVSIIGGNHHNLLGLLEAPEPFDFILPARPGVLPGRRIVPLAQVRAALKEHVATATPRILRLRNAFKVPTMHVASPPPIGDETHLRAHPRGFAPEDGAPIAIAPKSVRMKLYLLQNEILQAFCAQEGITFVAAPQEACDREGFLAEPYRLRDPTHGNKHYGRLVLEAIKPLAARHIQSAATPSATAAGKTGVQPS